MKMSRDEAVSFLKEKDNFCILTHRRPDGDTLGTSAFFCRMLRKMGKNAYILENPEITEKYAFLHQGLTKPHEEVGDTLVSVDVASKNMLPEAFLPLSDRISLRIDHHGTAQSFTKMELVEPEMAACGEIVYALAELLEIKPDKAMADALYTAVSTATGCFRYANTTANTLRVASVCAGVSDNLFRLNQELFDTNSLARLQVQGYMIENAKFLAGGKVAICQLPKAVEEQFGATEDDLENISGFPRSIAGVKLAATLRQENADTVKISVRAVPGWDASQVCAKFGGGGHKGAAGASIQLPMEEAALAVEKAILEML